MSTIAILGCMWGDEAKAKIVDYLGDTADYVVRFQGGSNAGHTIVVENKKFVFHTVPSGIMYPGTKCLIGCGMIIDPLGLVKEIRGFEAAGLKFDGRLCIDEKVGLVLPLHQELDKSNEERLASAKIGTTGRGIGPAYADMTARTGIRLGDLAHPDYLKQRIKELYAYHGQSFDDEILQKVMTQLQGAWEVLKEYCTSVEGILREAHLSGARIIFEGAQGTLLDRTWGSYPYVTSSNTIVDAIGIGSGFSSRLLDEVLGVFKSYVTRVGEGPFPTEIHGPLAEQIRKQGNEFGSTTGRPRRIGHFDAVMAAYSTRLNTLDGIALTLLDVLSGIEELKICVGYNLDGKMLDTPPAHPLDLTRVEPVYITLEGWEEDITGVRSKEALPANAQTYLEAIEDLLEVPVRVVSVGKQRNETFKIDI